MLQSVLKTVLDLVTVLKPTPAPHTQTIVGTLFLKNVAIYYHISNCVCKWQNKKYRAVQLHKIFYIIVNDTLLITHTLHSYLSIHSLSHTFTQHLSRN